MSRITNAPVKYTCSQVDEVVNSIENAIEALKVLPKKLEELRKANDALRQWGKDSQEIIEDLENQLDIADNKIYELEETIKLFSIS